MVRSDVGRLFVVSGPSGVGKGTVVRRVLGARPDAVLLGLGHHPRRRGPARSTAATTGSSPTEEFDRADRSAASCSSGRDLRPPVGDARRRRSSEVLAAGARRAAGDRRAGRRGRSASACPTPCSIFLVPPSRGGARTPAPAGAPRTGADLERRLATARRRWRSGAVRPRRGERRRGPGGARGRGYNRTVRPHGLTSANARTAGPRARRAKGTHRT